MKRYALNSDRAVPAYPPFLADAVRTPCKDNKATRDLFVMDEDRGLARERRVETAKVICSTCPFERECEQWAVDTYQTGVWGGTTDLERAHTRKRRTSYAAA